MLHDPDVWRALADERVQTLIRDASAVRMKNGRQPFPRGRLALLLRERRIVSTPGGLLPTRD